MTFAQKLRDWDEPLVLYEVIPPNRSAPREEIADQATYLANLLADHPIDAVNIPEIRNEERNGNRVAGFMEKYDPRQFGKIIQDVFQDEAELIANHAVAYAPPEEQEAWMQATFEKFDIPNLVLVGGESSSIDYPGPSVPEAARIATKTADATDACLGGITIPTRRRDDYDEPQRMIDKQRNGLEFFTSQVIYEGDPSRELIRDYDQACTEQGLDPAPIFLSFAPITGRKDARFLEWLGVHIPEPAKEWILATHATPLQRSTRVAEHVLGDVLDYADRRDLDVPIGINVEHIMRYNFDASEILLDHLESLLELQEIKRAHT